MSGDGAFDVSFPFEVEHQDRNLAFHTHLDGGHVHHLQVVSANLIVAELLVANCVWVLFGIVAVDAIDFGGLHDDLAVEFPGAKGGGGIGGDKGVTRAAGEDDDAAFFEVPLAASADVGFADGFHSDGAEQSCLAAKLFERFLECQAVHDGREHTHVMGGGFFDDIAATGKLGAPENIAAAYDDSQLHALQGDSFELLGERHGLIDADATFAIGVLKALATEFEKYPLVFGRAERRLNWISGIGHDHHG